MANREIGAAILAGGASRRMGVNKALLRLEDGGLGLTLIETVLERLREAGLHRPLLVTNSPQEYAFLGLENVHDYVSGAGVLGGILTALRHLSYERVFVVACDMPALNPELVRYMASLSLAAGEDALVPRWRDEAGTVRVEPLHAVYSRACIRPIEKRIEQGKLKVSDLLEDVSVRYITEEDMRRYDPQLRSFCNVNTPEEWARAFAENLPDRI